jgi:hypothetical protein
MPVRKFRSVAEMPQSALPRLDSRNIKLACDLSAAATRMRPVRVPAGVYKHRSLEDAQHLRRVWGA